MGQVWAAGPGIAPPPLAPPPTIGPPTGQASSGEQNEGAADAKPPQPTEEVGPGTFEDLHKKCKEVFPMPFEGAKVLVNKGLSNHFQVSHTLTMSSLQPSGYRFGCTYVGANQFGPQEMFPVMVGEVDPSGNVNAQLIHQISKAVRFRFSSQVQNGKWVATQLTTELRGKNYTAAATLGNPDFLNMQGVCVLQYLQSVTSRLSLGTEVLYQRGGQVPGGQMALFTLAGRYAGDKWTGSANITPGAGGVHTCYYHKLSDTVQMGVELEGSMRTQECQAILGYQIEMPPTFTFKGQIDTNYCIGAVLEKRLPPLPFSIALSAHANHVKSSYRFGIGLLVG